MDAAVIEFDALPDAIGAAADDQDLAFIRGPRLRLFLISRVIIGGIGFEFGGAGIDELIDGQQIFGKSPGADFTFRNTPELPQPAVRKAPSLRLPKHFPRWPFQLQDGLCLDNLTDLIEKPGIDACELMDLLEGHPVFQGRSQVEQPQGVGGDQFGLYLLLQARGLLQGFE
ncbi:MAG: hypothetical protein A4E70_02223 [Syntrophus sp. PtaU1.Bin005]|nr:MAG: hypothetical protein A4E69_02649 [Syntrophus sp. PtaB.Bin138]OPY79157.1 MAG: hypothetical protein A4E70_02223 [Syntrophus sp. PtaU1.Bin005]